MGIGSAILVESNIKMNENYNSRINIYWDAGLKRCFGSVSLSSPTDIKLLCVNVLILFYPL